MLIQLVFYAAVLAFGIQMFRLLVDAIEDGRRRRAAILVWCTSPVPLLLTALVIERRPVDGLSVAHLPFSLTFGDPLLVTLMAVVAADRRKRHPLLGQRPGRREKSICFMIGFAGGVTFHVWDVVGNYKPADMKVALSPAKVLHDFGTFPALFAMIVYTLWMITWKRCDVAPRHVLVIVLCLVGLLFLMALDGTRGLSAQTMHVPWYPDHSWNDMFHAWFGILHNLTHVL